MIDLGALAVGQLEDRVDVLAVGRPTVWSAPISPASASAFSEGSTTMISAGVSALRHWMPMWPEAAGADDDRARAGVQDAARPS